MEMTNAGNQSAMKASILQAEISRCADSNSTVNSAMDVIQRRVDPDDGIEYTFDEAVSVLLMTKK